MGNNVIFKSYASKLEWNDAEGGRILISEVAIYQVSFSISDNENCTA